MTELKKEQKMLLSLLRYAIHERKELLPEDLSESDITPILKEASAQAVNGMALVGLLALHERFSQEAEQNIRRMIALILRKNLTVSHTQSILVKRLDEHRFPYVILKGDAAAAYYPNPDMRMRGDVDFLIDPTQKKDVEQMLLGAGYISSQEGHVCHVVFKKPGAHLEMHFEPAGIPNGESGDDIRAFLSDTLQSGETVRNGFGAFSAPDALHHGLILLLHMQHHMLGEGIGLRHLCDWACYVQKTQDQPFWQETLLPFLQKIGLFIFAAVMTRTCAIYLDTPCPAWAEVADMTLCDDIMSDIFTGGNFGRKDTTRSESFVLVSNRGKTSGEHGKLYYLFYALNAAVKSRFYRFRKMYILYPVFYLCMGIRYLYRVAIGKRTPMHKLVAPAEKRKELFENLKVFERE